MHPILFELGVLKLSSYGLMLAIAFFLGMHIAERGGRREGISIKRIERLSWLIIFSAIVGARFLYTFVEHATYYFRHPLKFFAFHEGGLSFFGGLFFAIAASVWYCRKHKLSFWNIADIYTPTIALGLSIAKIGCFLAGCCFGKICDHPWGIAFTHPDSLADPKGIPLHPTQLYESLMNFGIFLLLVLFRRFQRFRGEIFFLFLFVYGLGRSYLETFRGNPGTIAGLPSAQFLSIPMVLLAIVWWVLRYKNRPTSDKRS